MSGPVDPSGSGADPFDVLASPVERIVPHTDFTRALRARLVERLGSPQFPSDPIPIIDLPDRRRSMNTPSTPGTTSPDTSTPAATAAVTPYLAVHDGAGALDFYEQAFGARVELRMAGDDGRLGHSEFWIGGARFYLADEYPEMDVTAPSTLGGTSVTLHLELTDVDAVFAAAVAAGANSVAEPADQPHGARHGTLTDPFGHRWILSQQIVTLSPSELGDRMEDAGFRVEQGSAAADPQGSAGIWSAINSEDAPAMIRFMIDVLGFRDDLVVPGEGPGEIVHSQLSWPEGGIVQVATAHRADNIFSERPVGGQSLYVITDDVRSVLDRCMAAGLEFVRPFESPDYDPDGGSFSIRDHEGNLWSFGTYRG